MSRTARDLNVAILLTDGFEQVEMTSPRQALQDAGAKAVLVSPKDETVKGWKHIEWGDLFPVDVRLAAADPADFDALMLPGGVINPDALRINPTAIEFIKAFFAARKPVAAICHGPWTLIEANAVRGREMTSWKSIKTDLQNAGARWVDREVVVDDRVVTSRSPDDLPAFNPTMIEVFVAG
jgi:protease I